LANSPITLSSYCNENADSIDSGNRSKNIKI
jgi:hypothetical protein